MGLAVDDVPRLVELGGCEHIPPALKALELPAPRLTSTSAALRARWAGVEPVPFAAVDYLLNVLHLALPLIPS